MEQTVEMTPISILRLLETTKEQRSTFVTGVLDKLEQGSVDPLETLLQIKCMEELVKQLTGNDVFRNYVLEAAQKEGKSFAFHNAKFDIRETGVKYDFSRCGDVQWELMDSQINGLKEQVKARETFLKTVPVAGLLVTDEFSGETTKIFPPSKISTTSVAVTLK